MCGCLRAGVEDAFEDGVSRRALEHRDSGSSPDWSISAFIGPFIGQFIDLFIGPLVHRFIHRSIPPSIHSSFIHWSIGPFIGRFVPFIGPHWSTQHRTYAAFTRFAFQASRDANVGQNTRLIHLS